MAVPAHEDQTGYRVDLTRGRALMLCREPGARPVPLWRLAFFNDESRSVGGVTFEARDACELFLSLQHMAALVDRQGIAR